MKLLNQTTFYCLIMVIFLGCSSKSKEEQILEKVAMAYLKEFQREFMCIEYDAGEEGFSLPPLIIEIREDTVYEGKKNYSIFHHYSRFSDDDLPTHLIKRDNVYIVMYLQGAPSLSRKDLPKSLMYDPDNVYGYLAESSFVVLICPNTYEYIVVHMEYAKWSYDCVKQLREFKCGRKISNINKEVKVEKEIVDREDPLQITR